MIAFVDKPPTFEPHGDCFLVTFQSGADQINLMLTPHAALYLEQKIRKAKAQATYAALGKEPIPFPKPKRRKR
jgi:hypothetical protein